MTGTSSRRRLPPLNALRAFEVAGRWLNFRAAAQELGVTQGAVSQQVRALEDHLGVRLFQRLPRGLALTPEGRGYWADVGRSMELLCESTARLQARPEVVTLSVTPTVASKLLIPQLPQLQATLPGVELRTVATESLSDFDRDQVDIAVRLTRAPLPAGLEAQWLFAHEVVAVASPHLLGERALPLSAAQLRALPLLHDAHDLWPAFLQTPRKLPGAVFNQTTLALDAAMAGQGVALACRALVQADLQGGRLRQLSPRCLGTDTAYFLVRKCSPAPRPAVQAVWQWCVEHWGDPPHAPAAFMAQGEDWNGDNAVGGNVGSGTAGHVSQSPERCFA